MLFGSDERRLPAHHLPEQFSTQQYRIYRKLRQVDFGKTV